MFGAGLSPAHACREVASTMGHTPAAPATSPQEPYVPHTWNQPGNLPEHRPLTPLRHQVSRSVHPDPSGLTQCHPSPQESHTNSAVYPGQQSWKGVSWVGVEGRCFLKSFPKCGHRSRLPRTSCHSVCSQLCEFNRH